MLPLLWVMGLDLSGAIIVNGQTTAGKKLRFKQELELSGSFWL